MARMVDLIHLARLIILYVLLQLLVQHWVLRSLGMVQTGSKGSLIHVGHTHHLVSELTEIHVISDTQIEAYSSNVVLVHGLQRVIHVEALHRRTPTHGKLETMALVLQRVVEEHRRDR